MTHEELWQAGELKPAVWAAELAGAICANPGLATDEAALTEWFESAMETASCDGMEAARKAMGIA